MAFSTFELSDPRYETDGLRYVTVGSDKLGGRGDCTLYVPPLAGATGPLPLVVLLHGVYASHWAWTLNIGVHHVARQLIASGQLRPLVIAMPSDGLWGAGSAYLQHGRRDFEGWIVDDVPALARQAVPALAPAGQVCLGGLSMGGYGALRLAGRHPARFAAVAAHSSITRLAGLAPFISPAEMQYYQSHFGPEEAAAYLLQNRAHLPPLRFDCGLADPLLADNMLLSQQLTRHGIAHEYEELPGDHSNAYWHDNIHRSLLFFERALASNPAG